MCKRVAQDSGLEKVSDSIGLCLRRVQLLFNILRVLSKFRRATRLEGGLGGALSHP